MIRFLAAATLYMSALFVVSANTAQAGVISRNNPYRSFNISGVNYGSMQWERKHGRQSGKAWSGSRANYRGFRRW
ncbi:MAG: hypothetical protein AB7G28_15565 [Pirellulales bacterium]